MATRFRYRSDTGFFPTLEKAWRKLKKLKILGQRGSCCRGCSVSEAATKLDEEEGFEGYLGGVHYNLQDRESTMSDPKGGMYLGFFANIEADADEAVTEQLAFAVASIAKLHFEAYGFDVEWNGNTNRRLKLTLKEDA